MRDRVWDVYLTGGCVELRHGWHCLSEGVHDSPGLSFISVSEAAWEAQQTAKMPRFYFDLAMAKQYLATGQTPFTPNFLPCMGLARPLMFYLKRGWKTFSAATPT
ncbi:MAG: hypothetical protein Ct9H300mP11_01050 [Chloroflexota bacterium]|nr:MAG: hypothetical protein Ct9H300mP11_01050 [Chloroflexota bacterium]